MEGLDVTIHPPWGQAFLWRLRTRGTTQYILNGFGRAWRMTQPVYISEEEVVKYLPWGKLFDKTEEAMKAVSHGTAIQPPRVDMPIPEKNGIVFTMPGYMSGNLSCKVITRFRDNSSRGLKTKMANIFLFNADTGELRSVVAGCEITARRTAAASAVASRALLKEWKYPRIMAIFGAGSQAFSHVHALTNIYKCGFDAKIRIWNHRYESAEKLAEKLRVEGYDVQAMPDTEEGAKACARNANLIVTATLSRKPVLKGAWVQPGAHINAVAHNDLDDELYRKSVIFTDTKTAAAKELPHIRELGVPIVGEIGQILSGELNFSAPSSEVDRPTTIFHSLGMAVEDALSAQLVYDEYTKANRSK